MLVAKKGRSLFSVLAIALSVGLLCSMFQLHILFNQDLQQQHEEEYGSANIRISAAPPVQGDEWKGIDTSVIEEVRSLDGVQSVGAALEGKMLGKILYEGQNDFIEDGTFQYVGVDNTKVTKEYYKFNKDLSDYEVVISQSLAKRWGIGVADSIPIDLLNGRQVTWQVVEVVPSTQGNKEWLFFHLPSLQEVLGLSERVNPLLVELESGVNVEEIGFDIKEQLPEDVRVDAMPQQGEKGEQYIFFRVYGYILSVIAFVASLLLVYSMMQITYRERLRELAVIRAVGGSASQLKKMVIYEWAFIGAIGALLGFIVAALFSSRSIVWLASLFKMDILVTEQSVGLFGMFITAILTWTVILITSLKIVKKVSETAPIQSFRESLGSVASSNGKWVWSLIGLILGLLLWGMGFSWADSDSLAKGNMSVLFSMSGGLFMIVALLSLTVKICTYILRAIILLPGKLTGRLFLLAAQRLLIEKTQLFAVVLMAIVITVYIPIATLFQFMGQSSDVSLADDLEADFVLSAQQEFAFYTSSQMPAYLMKQLAEIDAVDKVLPLPTTGFAQLNTSEKESEIYYGVTSLTLLAEWDLVTISEEALDNAAVMPQSLAEELNVQLGDSLSVMVDDESVTVTIVGITNKMDQFPYYEGTLFIDDGNTMFQLSGLNEIYLDIEDGYEEEMARKLNLLQRQYPEMRWLQTTEAMSSFEAVRQQNLAMLQGITMIIMIGSIGGVLNALNAGVYARRREYAVLRAIYLTPSQMIGSIAWQGVLLAILSLVIGTVMAMILLFSIYNSSSGFHELFTFIPYKDVGVLYLILFVLAIVSTVPVAGKLARMKVMDAFKAEG